jgi:hypothetical protein
MIVSIRKEKERILIKTCVSMKILMSISMLRIEKIPIWLKNSLLKVRLKFK